MGLSYIDTEDLRYAKMLLENPGFAAKLINIFGAPFEKGFQYLPDSVSRQINNISRSALIAALNFAVFTLGNRPEKKSADKLHKLAVAASGCAGGFFGLTALGIELPVATTIMLRSIADIARSEAEDIQTIESKLACIEVFAFGSRSHSDDSVETGYYAIRAALSKAVSDAASYLAEKELAETGAPILVRLITQIGSRFGIVVSEKVAASAVPIFGAAGSALVNTVFMEHFQEMARGHFIIRRLERFHGKEIIKNEYNKL